MAKKLHGLGRGLDALLPEADALEAGMQEIPLGEIDPNPDQPRRIFPEETLTDLAQSIREHGVLQPLLLTPSEGGRYRIIAGERRWRAARMAGLDTVPCIVRDLDVIRQMEIALVENLQREDLNPLDQAAGIRALMRQCGYTQETVAERLGKSRPAVANSLRLLKLPKEVQELLRDGTLSAGHARVLAGLENAALQRELAEITVRDGLSVRALEKLAQDRKNPPPERHPASRVRQLPAELCELETRLREALGVRATLTGTPKKGKIVLQYRSLEELEHLNNALLRLEEENE